MNKTTKLIFLFALFCALSISAFAQQPKRSSIVVVDFVKTKTGQYEDAIKYYEAGWLKARVEAKKRGYIVSYKLLTLGDIAEGDWNIMLMTEFGDQQSYDASEENFKKVFAKILPDSKPLIVNGKTANDLRVNVFNKVLNAPASENKR